MKEKENQFTKGNIYRFDYLSRIGRFHYQNVSFARYVGPFHYEGKSTWSDDSIPAGEYYFVGENNEPQTNCGLDGQRENRRGFRLWQIGKKLSSSRLVKLLAKTLNS